LALYLITQNFEGYSPATPFSCPFFGFFYLSFFFTLFLSGFVSEKSSPNLFRYIFWLLQFLIMILIVYFMTCFVLCDNFVRITSEFLYYYNILFASYASCFTGDVWMSVRLSVFICVTYGLRTRKQNWREEV